LLWLIGWLATERGIWGQHLIVVPTSVMINWEMEFKRWLPAFRVLCYHGSAKERKEKRKGWSDSNSFHVCITSYQLVVQDQRGKSLTYRQHALAMYESD
jgi:SNF2 family DNA or RNA helicase